MPNCIILGNTSLTKGDFNNIRNALAHFHIEHIAEDGEICGFKLWNGEWKMELRVDQLRAILEQMHDHLKRENKPQ